MSAAVYTRVAERAAKAGIVVSVDEVERLDVMLFVESEADRKGARLPPRSLPR